MHKWDKIFQKGVKYRPLNKILLNKILNKIKEDEPNNSLKSIIDIGCGMGDDIFEFSQKGFCITGIDISDIAIQKTKELLQKENVKNLKLLVMDVSEISSIKEKFDIIFSKLTYASIGNKEKFIEDIKNLMNENSVFVLMTPVLYKDINYTPEDKPRIAVNFEETKKLFENNFGSVEIFHHNYFSKNGDTITFLIRK